MIDLIYPEGWNGLQRDLREFIELLNSDKLGTINPDLTFVALD